MDDARGRDSGQLSREDCERRLAEFGQQHLLQFWDELDARQQQGLLKQIAAIDVAQIERLAGGGQDEEDWEAVLQHAGPPPAFRLDRARNRFTQAAAQAAAEEALAAGKLGIVLVAGGQGTRLGFDHPKGMFRLGPVSDRSLFQMHIDQLRVLAQRYQVRLPLYLMTSPATDEETVEFLESHDRFGLPSDDLLYFCQGTMPAIDDEGRILLEEKGRIFLSPDGHGGMLAALAGSGCLRDARQRGIEQLFYFQVDNPLVRLCDRELVGYHLLAESEMSTQVVAKQSPDDKVGNVVSVGGQLRVIEYSDLPADAGGQREADGSLRFWAGSIAIHVFSIEFLERCMRSDESLPFHRARKKVPCVDRKGITVTPEKPNATKFEKFIFDLMPLAHNAIVVEADEREVFAPLKNASGAEKDTPEACRQAIVDRSRRWLKSVGAVVDPNAMVEIHPDFALDREELRQRVPPGEVFRGEVYLQGSSK